MEKIIYKTETGIAVITPTHSIKEAMKDIPKGAEYKIVEEHEIGGLDRTFRNAWTYDMKIDIPKAKEIWKEKLRRDREPLLKQLDVDYMRALESGDLTDTIIVEKNRLRDITERVDSAKTIKSIKEITI